MRTAFRVVVDNNWQGIAYLMLEVAGLDFVEAIQVMTRINKSLQRKIKLLSKKRKLLRIPWEVVSIRRKIIFFERLPSIVSLHSGNCA